MPRQRKRFMVIAPRYTFRNAKSCIASENEVLNILAKERRLYRRIMDGPDGPNKEFARFHTLVGIAFLKVKQSDGRFLTRDLVNNQEYTNSRLPDPNFKPIYLIGHKADFYLDKEDRDSELQECIDVMCKTNEMKDQESFFAIIKFLNMTTWWRTTQATDIRKEITEMLKAYKSKADPAEATLINMVCK